MKLRNLVRFSLTLTELFNAKKSGTLGDLTDQIMYLLTNTNTLKEHIKIPVFYADGIKNSEFAKKCEAYDHIKDLTSREFWSALKTFGHWADSEELEAGGAIRNADDKENIRNSMVVEKFLGMKAKVYVLDLKAER
jgi:hypothetical protein